MSAAVPAAAVPGAAADPAAPRVHLADVHKRLGGRVVLDGLSLDVRAGEVYGLLGANGSGKSTAVNLVCNLLAADRGLVQVCGVAVGRGTLRRVGLCPQEIALYRELDAVENLDFFARMNGLAPPLRRHRIAQLVDLFGLAPYRGVPVGRLSGGWQRRVNVAVALVHGPEVLVLDEPTAALDVAARQALWEALGALERDGLAVLLTSHHLDEVQRACSRVGILRAGRIAAEGSIAQLLARVPAQAVATLAGSDAATVRRRAAALGWPVRAWGGALACLLPRALSLREVVEAFEGVPVSSVAVQPVTLEHAYLEVLGAGEPDTAPAAAGPADA